MDNPMPQKFTLNRYRLLFILLLLALTPNIKAGNIDSEIVQDIEFCFTDISYDYELKQSQSTGKYFTKGTLRFKVIYQPDVYALQSNLGLCQIRFSIQGHTNPIVWGSRIAFNPDYAGEYFCLRENMYNGIFFEGTICNGDGTIMEKTPLFNTYDFISDEDL